MGYCVKQVLYIRATACMFSLYLSMIQKPLPEGPVFSSIHGALTHPNRTTVLHWIVALTTGLWRYWHAVRELPILNRTCPMRNESDCVQWSIGNGYFVPAFTSAKNKKIKLYKAMILSVVLHGCGTWSLTSRVDWMCLRTGAEENIHTYPTETK